MLSQKRKEQIKAYDKQEKRIKELKAGGSSKKQAVSTIVILHVHFSLASTLEFCKCLLLRKFGS